MMKPLSCVILAAGAGTRLRTAFPKVLHSVCGKPMIEHILNALDGLGLERTVVVVGFARDQVVEALKARKGIEYAIQEQLQGTGHAVMMAQKTLKGFKGDVLIVNGDVPLIRHETVMKLVSRHRHQDAAASILTTEMPGNRDLGRIIRNDDNTVAAIREYRDANKYERQIPEVNTGIYCFDSELLWDALGKIGNDNAKGEYYLTDVIQILVSHSKRVEAVIAEDPVEVMGVNDRIQQSAAEAAMRRRIILEKMVAGVTVIDPETTYIDDAVVIGQDVVIEPGTHLRGITRVASGASIGPQAIIEDSVIGENCSIINSILRGVEVGAGCRIIKSYVAKATIPEKETLINATRNGETG